MIFMMKCLQYIGKKDKKQEKYDPYKFFSANTVTICCIKKCVIIHILYKINY